MLALVLFAATLIRMVTTLGSIDLRLDPVHAPLSTAAFLKYVDAHRLDGSTFYRVVRDGNHAPHRRIHVIQGGLDLDRAPFGTIPLERTTMTGLRNLAGTIAVPRDAAPDSGVGSDFFINTADDPLLDADHSRDGYGYAVFGRVVRGDGRRAAHRCRTRTRATSHAEDPHLDRPPHYRAVSGRRGDHRGPDAVRQKVGAPRRTRTFNQLIKSQLLYH